jgi:hypothetical protein
MERKGTEGAADRHAGAAFGLVIGVTLGSLLLNVPGVAEAARDPEAARALARKVLSAVLPSARAAAPGSTGGQVAAAPLAAAAFPGASTIRDR